VLRPGLGELTLRGSWTAALAEEAKARPARSWKSLMTIAGRKRDAQGNLLPLQSYDETIRRGMAFILKDHPAWFKGPPATLLDEKGQVQPAWVYYSNLQHDGTPFANSVDRFVSYPAFHTRWQSELFSRTGAIRVTRVLFARP